MDDATRPDQSADTELKEEDLEAVSGGSIVPFPPLPPFPPFPGESST